MIAWHIMININNNCYARPCLTCFVLFSKFSCEAFPIITEETKGQKNWSSCPRWHWYQVYSCSLETPPDQSLSAPCKILTSFLHRPPSMWLLSDLCSKLCNTSSLPFLWWQVAPLASGTALLILQVLTQTPLVLWFVRELTIIHFVTAESRIF